MSKLDQILIVAKAGYASSSNWDYETKQAIKDLMLITYHKAVLQDGDLTDNFIKEVEQL